MADPTPEQTAIEKAAAEHQIAEHEAATARLRLERAKAEQEAAKLAEPMPAEEAATQEATLAKLKLERATLERDIAKLARPWWRSWNVTALGAFLAAVAPATAGVTGYFEKQKQIALEAQKQNHDIDLAQQKWKEETRSRYLDRILDAHQSRRTLRLLIATTTDKDMRKWAEEELPFIAIDERRNDEKLARLSAQADKDEELLRDLLKLDKASELAKHIAATLPMEREEIAKANDRKAWAYSFSYDDPLEAGSPFYHPDAGASDAGASDAGAP